MRYFHNIVQLFALQKHLMVVCHLKCVDMKPLILSFFAIILCYSLLTYEKEEVKTEPVPVMNENSVFFEVQPNLQPVDSAVIFRNEIAVV